MVEATAALVRHDASVSIGPTRGNLAWRSASSMPQYGPARPSLSIFQGWSIASMMK